MLARQVAIALIMLCVGATRAMAATCNPTPGVQQWNSIAGLATTGCTEVSTDDWLIDDGDTVILNFDLGFTGSTGFVEIDPGGTLIVSLEGSLDWSGATDGSLRITGGTFAMQGAKLWDGRIEGVPTCSEGTPDTCVIPLPLDVSSVIAAGDRLCFSNRDNPESGWISEPPQTRPGAPEAGKFRPSYSRMRCFPISASDALSVTIVTDEFASVGLTDSAVYAGTRGPALETPTALSELVTMPGAHETQIAVTGFSVLTLSDLTGQYVRFESGACAGQHFAVTHSIVDTGDDSIFIAGDADRCGLADVTIGFGIRDGDPVEIVRQARIVGGSSAGQRAHIEWLDGSFQADYGGFYFLDAAGASAETSQDWANNCQLCIFQTETQDPDFATSWIRNSDFAFGTSNGGDTGVISFMNQNSTATALLTSRGPLDPREMEIADVYIHDQAVNVSGGGNHAILVQSSHMPAIDGLRVERIADDGIAWVRYTFGAGPVYAPSVRDVIVTEINPTTSNSAQCLDVGVDTTGSGESEEVWVQRGGASFSHVFASGCADGTLDLFTLGASLEGVVASSSEGVSGVRIGKSLHLANVDPPAGALASAPNVSRDAIYLIGRGALGTGNPAIIGGELLDSVIDGAEAITSSQSLREVTKIERSYVDLGSMTSDPFLFRSTAADTAVQVPLVEVRSSVLLGNNKRTLCDDFDAATVSDILLERVWFGVLNTNESSGFLQNCTTPTDGTMTVTANGVTIAATTPSATASFGCGYTDGVGCRGTEGGATLSNVVVESTAAITSANAMGPAGGADAIHVPLLHPDPDEQAPLRSYRASGNGALISDLSRPQTYGLSRLGVAAAALGDGFLGQLEHWSTLDDIWENALPIDESPIWSAPIFQ